MNLHKRKYNLKFIVLAMVSLTIILGLWSTLFYNSAKRTIEGSFRNLAETTALTLSNIVEESTDEYRLLLETHDTDTEFYETIFHIFHDVTQNSDIKFAYTVQRKNASEIYYIIDSVPLGEENSTPIGTVWETGEFANEAFDTNRIVTSDFNYYSSWEDDYLCAYSPIIAPDTGEMLGLVGIDINIHELRLYLNYLRYSAIAAMIVILLVVYFILSKISNTLVRPYVIDTLTKAYNRKFFIDYLEQSFQICQRKQLPCSVLMIDIDHFKKINDTYGHPFGDEVLKKLSECMIRNIGRNDCFARYGGEEFTITMKNVTESDALEVAKRLKDAVGCLIFQNKELNIDVKITISIGIASTDATPADTYKNLIEKSDKALYFAKVDRNSVKSYTEYLMNEKNKK